MTQVPLPMDLPRRTALGRDSFFVSPANAEALAMIDAPERWPEGRLVLSGPAGAGKTHLAHVWAAQDGARILHALDLAASEVPNLTRAPLCLEAADRLAGDRDGETALFHLLNEARAKGTTLLLTGRNNLRDWPVTLPDLASRLAASGQVRLALPDDALLTAVLAKLFADRQIVPAATVIPYLVARMPRSFDAAARLVADIDDLALGTKGGATRDKAHLALARLAPEGG